MTRTAVALREAWIEFRFGLKSVVVALTFIGLVGYLLMVLTNADYLQQMGSIDVPRNAPNLIYLMSSGDVFFLFFAWAWVFAQPVVRDRQASLHELVLTAPVSLRALLLGRYLGALAVGLLLGLSQLAGFLLSPLLEVSGLVPAGSIGPTPWAAMAWASLIFILLPTAGIGALYFALALKFRSSTGPFAASAALIALWMFSMIVLSEGGILVDFAVVTDPSGFGDVDRMNKSWTPIEKATILYPLSTPFVVNRLLWGVVPIFLMLWVVRGMTREQLIQGHSTGKTQTRTDSNSPAVSPREYVAAAAVTNYNWWRTTLAEMRWQHTLLFSGKVVYLVILGLVTMTTASGFVHGINHADGPFQARPEFTLPVLNDTNYLIIAFIAAALVGRVFRRDQQAGIVEILDASPVPPWVCFIAKLTAVGTLTFLLLLTPGLAAILLALLSAPQSFSFSTPFIYQVAIYGPGLAELVAVTVLLHCLIRRTGAAYAASMLATFIMVVNHEAGLVTYPPLEFGIPAHIDYSVLTGWGVWWERLLMGDAFKLLVVLFVIAMAATVQIRGFDSRLYAGAKVLRERLTGPLGVAGLTSLVGCVFLYTLLDRRFVEEGGYQSRDQALEERAIWETAWLPTAGEWSVAGGALKLAASTVDQQVSGRWQLNEVRTAGKWLHLELPDDLHVLRVSVDGSPATVETGDGHAALQLGACHSSGCNVIVDYEISPGGWDTEGGQRWLSAAGVWADARQLAPRLGVDYNKRIVAAADRARFGLPETTTAVPRQALQAMTGIAPRGEWHVEVLVDGKKQSLLMNSALDFVVLNAAHASFYPAGTVTVLSDRTRGRQAALVAEDVIDMKSCVTRRLGAQVKLHTVAQLPRGMGETKMAGGTLLLAEEPHWDAGESGTSRWRRQSQVAASLAGDVLARQLDLRQNDGAQAFLSGVSGAIGYLCAGDANGVDAVVALLTRASERISRALAAAEAPVTEVSLDTTEKWLDEYVQAAYISWIANASANQLQTLLAAIEKSASIRAGLAAFGGTQFAEEMLGVPTSVELSIADLRTAEYSIERFVWSAGGWHTVADPSRVIGLRTGPAGFLVAHPVAGEAEDSWEPGQILLVDAATYERNPADNKVSAP